MRRVLFVDDEQNVLDGLRNMLRRQRHVWDMVFAAGAEVALSELAKAPFDVVVSDMRMPVINGAALLQTVKQKYPSVARIILSGYAEREAVVGALPVAHQFLSKPCDPDTLRVVVERACELQALLTDEAIRSVVGRLDTLPSVPRTYWELRRAVDEPNVSAGDIAAIVEKDPAMSVKILQLVNSAYFGLARRMTSVRHAVSYLGIELLKGLALTAHVFATMEASRVEGFSLDELQQNSLLAAQVAKKLLANPKQGEEAFTATLVHDIGKIVVAVVLPDRFTEIVRAVRKTGRSFHSVEMEMMGVSHAEIGAYLLGVWGLPFTIVEAVAYHHTPSALQGSELCEVLAAVHVADALVDIARSSPAPDPDRLDVAFVERAGFGANLPTWRALADRAIRQATESSG